MRLRGKAQLSSTAYSEGTKNPRYIPVDLSTPLFRLTGNYAHMMYNGIVKQVV